MTGLVGWWPLHEDSGNTARDLSGNGNHGSLNGGVTQSVAGKGGLTSYSFDGANDYITCGASGVSVSSDKAVTGWIRLNSTSQQCTVLQDNQGSNDRFNIDYNANGSNALQVWAYDGSTIDRDFYTINDTDWHFFVAVLDSGNSSVKLYVDGKEESINPGSSQFANGATTLDIGRNSNDGRYFSGNISNIRVYNRALSPEEIQTLYEWGSGDYARPLNDSNSSSAVSRWAFDGDATDTWGNNDGGLNGVDFKRGVKNQAANFVSDNQEYVSLFEQPDPPFSLSYWVNFDSVSGEQVQIAAYDPRNSNTQGVISRINNGELSVYNGNSNISLGVSPKTGNWYNIALVFSSSSTKLYLNGDLKSKSNNTANSSEQTMDVGRRFSNNGDTGYLDGRIDDLRLYNKALSPSEVFELYRWGTRGVDMRKKLVNQR